MSDAQYISGKVYSGAVTGTVLDVDSVGPVRWISLDVYNTTGTTAYLQIFSTSASNVSIGTTAPFLSIGMPGVSKATTTVGVPVVLGGNGFSIAGTTTRAGSTGAALHVNIIY